MRPRLTYANVTATLALIIALGGTSYAAIKLPADSVGTKQIKAGAVTNAEVRKRSLTANRLAPGAFEAPRLRGTVRSMNAPTGGPVAQATANCDEGQIATGGGFLNQSAVGGSDGYELVSSAPRTDATGTPVGWSVSARTGAAGPTADGPYAFVVCAR